MTNSSKHPRLKKLLRLLVEVGVVVLLVSFIFWSQTRSLVRTGDPAPDFSLQLYQSTTDPSFDPNKATFVGLDELKGKKSVIVFWAPWCGVCRSEASTVNDLDERIGEETNIYTVVLDYENLESVQSFIDETGLKAPVLLGTPSTSRDFKVNTFPTVYMIDESGKVFNHTIGFSTELGIRARIFFHDLF